MPCGPRAVWLLTLWFWALRSRSKVSLIPVQDHPLRLTGHTPIHPYAVLLLGADLTIGTPQDDRHKTRLDQVEPAEETHDLLTPPRDERHPVVLRCAGQSHRPVIVEVPAKLGDDQVAAGTGRRHQPRHDARRVVG